MNRVEMIVLTPEVIQSTLHILRQFGARGCEGLVLWTGEIGETAARITKVVLPEQHPISSEGGIGYFVDAETLFSLNRELSNSGLRLIAQVHSHPTEAYHSDADDRYAIVTADGGLSLVVPDFGDAPPDPVCWAVYRLRSGAWCKLSKSEVQSLVRIEQTS